MATAPTITTNDPTPIKRESVTVRASSLAELFDCPARWAAKYIHNMKMPTNPKALLGTAVHRSTALYDQSILTCGGLTVDESAGAAVDAIYKSDEPVLWEDEKPGDVEKIALALHQKYCTEIAPTQKYTDIELECEKLAITDLGLVLTGTTDRVREDETGFGISDIKTGRSIVNKDGDIDTKGHAYQLGLYELLAEHAGGKRVTAPAEIIGLTTAKTDAGQRVGRASVPNARSVLIGNEFFPGVLQHASRMIHSGDFYGNPKSMMCHKNYCPVFHQCPYRR